MKSKKLFVMIFTALAFVITFSGAISASASKWHKGIPIYFSGRYGKAQSGDYLYSLNWNQKDSSGSYSDKYGLYFDDFSKGPGFSWTQSIDTNTFTNEAKSTNMYTHANTFSSKKCKWKKTKNGYYIKANANVTDNILKIKVIKKGLNDIKIVEYINYQNGYMKILNNATFQRAKKINHLI